MAAIEVARWTPEPEVAGARPRPADGPRGRVATRVALGVLAAAVLAAGFVLLGMDHGTLSSVLGAVCLGVALACVGAWVATEHANEEALHLARNGIAVEAEIEAAGPSRWVWVLGPLHLLLALLTVVAAFHGSGGGDVGGSIPERVRYRFRLPGGAWATGVSRLPDGHRLAQAGARATVLVDPVDTRRHDLWLHVAPRVRVAA